VRFICTWTALQKVPPERERLKQQRILQKLSPCSVSCLIVRTASTTLLWAKCAVWSVRLLVTLSVTQHVTFYEFCILVNFLKSFPAKWILFMQMWTALSDRIDEQSMIGHGEIAKEEAFRITSHETGCGTLSWNKLFNFFVLVCIFVLDQWIVFLVIFWINVCMYVNSSYFSPY